MYVPSGAQAGSYAAQPTDGSVIRVSPEPSAFITNSARPVLGSELLPRYRSNAMRWPSGDQFGLPSSFGEFVNPLGTPPPLAFATIILPASL